MKMTQVREQFISQTHNCLHPTLAAKFAGVYAAQVLTSAFSRRLGKTVRLHACGQGFTGI